MSQFNAPVRRSGGELDVYTGLLCAAFVVLVAGVSLMALKNIDHSAADRGGSGGMLKLVESR
ncbi:MAG TPA: hypothetical protein PK400_06545 [Phycisphaerales bacterium]|nr:hypothetical protein [Phycisphaerales bacterium]HRQ75646.1 hypothetical protein [Phycisphaerales bacterium]